MRRQSNAACLSGGMFVASLLVLGCSRTTQDDSQRPAPGPSQDTYTTEITEYHSPPPGRDDALADDHLDAKRLPPFNRKLVDSRPLGDWEVNASAAVVGLDCPMIRPDAERELLILRKSYVDAISHARYGNLLPRRKCYRRGGQAIRRWPVRGTRSGVLQRRIGIRRSAPEVVRRAFEKLPAGSPARPFLAAALQLADSAPTLTAKEASQKQRLLDAFEADESRSKPISFYIWTPELGKVWRFYRFLQTQFSDEDSATARPLAAAFGADPAALKQYRAINGFYDRLTNPRTCLSIDALLAGNGSIKGLAEAQSVRHAAAAVFPPSTSRHAELFEELFPLGLPEGTDLMRTLIRKIRSGEVDLKPGEKDGWFQYQVYALETLLVPSRGASATSCC